MLLRAVMREKPNFDKKVLTQSQSRNDDWWGFAQVLLICVIGYIALSSIGRVISGRGENIDGIIFPGTLVCLTIAVILVERNKKKEKQRLHEAQQEWKRTCKSEEVAIVSRQSASYESYFDDYGDLHNGKSSYSLDLETTADQKAVNPNLTSISVKVYSNIYEKLEKRDTVRIYYKPEAPLTFLLEEEV
jgi:hypothetical protein